MLERNLNDNTILPILTVGASFYHEIHELPDQLTHLTFTNFYQLSNVDLDYFDYDSDDISPSDIYARLGRLGVPKYEQNRKPPNLSDNMLYE